MPNPFVSDVNPVVGQDECSLQFNDAGIIELTGGTPSLNDYLARLDHYSVLNHALRSVALIPRSTGISRFDPGSNVRAC